MGAGLPLFSRRGGAELQHGEPGFSMRHFWETCRFFSWARVGPSPVHTHGQQGGYGLISSVLQVLTVCLIM